MSGRANGRGHRRGAVGAAVDPFNDRFPDDTATFDDLADVFLGVHADTLPGAERDALPRAQIENSHAIVTPPLSTPGRDVRTDTRGFDSLALRPGEMRSPKSNLGGGGGGGGGGDDGDGGDGGGGSGGGGGGSPRNAARAVELLVLGHLPALASVWGSQYLRDLARTESAPIASVRLQAGFASVEMFEFGPGTGLAAVAASERQRTFDEALALAAQHSSRWVLRVDGADELDFIDGKLVSRVTLATGADEAATISAYRTIKRMATRIESLSPVTPPKLHVVVMGTNPEQNQRTGEKLASTAKACLGRDVGFHTSAARIGAVRPAVLLFNGKADVRPRNVLATLETAIRAHETRTALQTNPNPLPEGGGRGWVGTHIVRTASDESAARPATTPRENRTDDSDLFERDLLNDDQILAEVAASLAAGLPASTSAGLSDAARVSTAPTTTRPAQATVSAQAVETKVSSPLTPAPLATYVDALTALGLSCPYAPSVEIACDHDGRVHVLTRFDEGSDETAMGQLMIAAEWAHAHAVLLRAAAPQLARSATNGHANGLSNGLSNGHANGHSNGHTHPASVPQINPALSPTRHVFTSEPRKIRRLLETDVRVHLLSRVCTGAAQKWFSVPLN